MDTSWKQQKKKYKSWKGCMVFAKRTPLGDANETNPHEIKLNSGRFLWQEGVNYGHQQLFTE